MYTMCWVGLVCYGSRIIYIDVSQRSQKIKRYLNKYFEEWNSVIFF